MNLSDTSLLFRTLSDGTRIRLLALLEVEELTVAELSAVTQLAQPRVSTHLSRLKELDLVRDRRAGVSAYYRFNGEANPALMALWKSLRAATEDALLADDALRLTSVLSKRANQGNWADSVAGDMERHYSPGRTWEALARALTGLISLGDVLDLASGDGVLAELLSPRARSIVCIDASERVVDAARRRLQHLENIEVRFGDMHTLDSQDSTFDLVLLMHALTYAKEPTIVFAEAARVLRPGGQILGCTLAKHAHKKVVEPFDHRNLGFSVSDLRQLTSTAGLEILHCETSCRERRIPHFEILNFLARKPA